MKLLKSMTHRAYIISEKDLREIIYQLETGQPREMGNLADQLKRVIRESICDDGYIIG